MDEELDPGLLLEGEILKFLRAETGATYAALDSWALVVRARSNHGEGDTEYGGLFIPNNTDRFTVEGLRWLFSEGIKHRYEET